MNLCACTGPMRGDPMCPCRMKAAGLTPTGPTPEEEAKLREVLTGVFAPPVANASTQNEEASV